MSFDVAGKIALITGANRGIGLAIAKSCLKHGIVKLYAAVRDPQSAQHLVSEFGEKVQPLAVDLTKPETIAAAAATADDVSLVVNNAGVLRMANPLDSDAIDFLQYEIDVNLIGLIRMSQAFAPILAANGGGAFVQLNSVASLKTFADITTYSCSKAATYAWTQGLRDALKQQGTHVLSVHPGPIETDMARDAGFQGMTEPASVVGEGVVEALRDGRFQLFPDEFAQGIGDAYAQFADQVINAEPSFE